MRKAQLLYIAEPLKVTMFNDLEKSGSRNGNEAVNRVVKYFCLAQRLLVFAVVL